MPINPDWFRTWFNSPYYALLYDNRSDAEAQSFISKLTDYIGVKKGQSALDLACGRGRHSIQLHKTGLIVTGIDLSANSISQAQLYCAKGLEFLEADMRNFDLEKQFDFVFNLFTSFGYFSREENALVLSNIHSHLVQNGLLVIDYFNSFFVVNEMLPEQHFLKGNVQFRITKKVEGDCLIKKIHVLNGEHNEEFMERVTLFHELDFNTMLRSSGFKVMDTFGDYNLTSFNLRSSPRLILVAKKL